jgi:hypothetical protein
MIELKTGGTDSPLRVLICGGRTFGKIITDDGDIAYEKSRAQYNFIMYTLEKIAHELHQTRKEHEWEDEYGNWLPRWHIISGAAPGVDTVAIDWAITNWCSLDEYPANWKRHGRRAGFIRNKQMLDEGKPDLVIAFPGGNGTANMVRISKEAGVPVREISYVEN